MHEETVAGLDAAMERAVELARRGPERGPNPRVGCVLLAPAARDGGERRRVVGEGFHRGAGTAHAEVEALADAARRGGSVRGATAVVTLEPCSHRGRTGPCVDALVEAGVAQVVYALEDPDPVGGGGAGLLRAAGVDVEAGIGATAVEELLHVWLTAVRRGRPYVTAKLAVSLDGRVAAPDGSSRWITGPRARAHAHTVRSRVDAIAVGTGTVLADDPALTAREPDGELSPDQPLRVVVGLRDVPASARLRGPGGALVGVRTRDMGVVVEELAGRGVRHLLVEGGPGVTTAFVRAGLVDEVHAYVAPVLVGGGRPVVGDLGVSTLGAASRWVTRDVVRLGSDVLMVLRAGVVPGSGSWGSGREW